MMNKEFKIALISLLLGGIISFFVSKWFYQKSNNDTETLREGIEKLKNSEKDILLIGSGTVAKYLDEFIDKDSIGKQLIQHSNLVTVPSLEGLEVLLACTDIHYKSVPIISMTSFSFDNTVLDSLKKVYDVDELYYSFIKKDTLVVTFYMKQKESIFKSFLDNCPSNCITIMQLDSLLNIESPEFHVFITNPGSGTRLAFEKAIQVNNHAFYFDDNNSNYRRYSITTSDSLTDGTYEYDALILHSEIYSNDEKGIRKKIFDGNEDVLKDLGIYYTSKRSPYPNFASKNEQGGQKEQVFINNLIECIKRIEEKN